MRILDRYIARQYLTNVVILLICLYMIVVLVDFSLNFDEFFEIAGRLAEQSGKSKASTLDLALYTAWVGWDLWWPRFFQLYSYLLGFVMVAGMGFTCAQLVKHREFVAVLAGGVSLQRLARPMVVVAIVLAGLAVVNRELVVPKLAPLLTRDKKQAGTQSLGTAAQPLCADGKGRIFYARLVDLDSGNIDGLWVWERDQKGLMTARIRADRAQWENGHWRLSGGVREAVRAPEDRTVLPAPEPITELQTDLDPTALRLRRFEGFGSNLSTAQLTQLISRYRGEAGGTPGRLNELERLRWGRFSLVTGNVLTLLICLPFFLRREPCSMLVQSVYCAPAALLATLGAVVGATADIPGLPPQVSAFVPVMVMIPLAIAAVSSIKT